ncbi:hypothetical protein [Flexivirga caeni]|uniref:Uncharacterized protein n=1 Tax=Flexivirga caeni TaxID=2294115 RepID=A0A3M9MII7_9MICO|nr:hypothetical protein [Flexivirga caeni]RNI25314.1 hypothetical protein EFY87_01385 [Flexivirga caeni]
MIEYLMVFPERDTAQFVADGLLEEGNFTEVRVVREALAGEDDAEAADWTVQVLLDTIDDPAGAVARALAERFGALAAEHDGWLDEHRSTAG